MQIVITAVGPDHVGLADPIIHAATAAGGNIAEIQMYDHDEEALFALMTRVDIAEEVYDSLGQQLRDIAGQTGLEIRLWSPTRPVPRPKLAICCTYLTDTPAAVLAAIADGRIAAEASVMIGNRDKCESLAAKYQVPWEMIGRDDGTADDAAMVELLDRYDVDYVILARYMRVLPPTTCWKYAGGRIINLHHGLLPSFPGLRPYHDAYASRMLVYGATCHFIVPELDAGNQIINQRAFDIRPGTPLTEIIARGQSENEPQCLVEGVRRVVDREVQLHFHRVIAPLQRLQ